MTIQHIAETLNVARDTASNKLSGKTPLSFHEALIIEERFFPGTDLHYLFALEEQRPDSAG